MQAKQVRRTKPLTRLPLRAGRPRLIRRSRRSPAAHQPLVRPGLAPGTAHPPLVRRSALAPLARRSSEPARARSAVRPLAQLTPLARAARPPLVAPTRAARPRLAPWIICCSIPLSGFATPFLASRFPELDSVGTWFLAARMEKQQKGFVDT
jgi:hypothetical protein